MNSGSSTRNHPNARTPRSPRKEMGPWRRNPSRRTWRRCPSSRRGRTRGSRRGRRGRPPWTPSCSWRLPPGPRMPPRFASMASPLLLLPPYLRLLPISLLFSSLSLLTISEKKTQPTTKKRRNICLIWRAKRKQKNILRNI